MDNSCRNRNELLIPAANHLAFESKHPLNIWGVMTSADESGEAAMSRPAWAMLTPLGFTSSPR